MKKKAVIPVTVILILIAFAALFFLTPKKFGRNADWTDVDRIEVFDGNTGVGFTIDAPEDIQYIVENFQSRRMRIDGLSVGRMGYGLKITCLDARGRAILPEIILNSEDTIRRDPFFYRCGGGLCFEYIRELESRAEGSIRFA